MPALWTDPATVIVGTTTHQYVMCTQILFWVGVGCECITVCWVCGGVGGGEGHSTYTVYPLFGVVFCGFMILLIMYM